MPEPEDTNPAPRPVDELTLQLYDSLRAIAGRLLRREPARNAVRATDLVHECYLKLAQLEDFRDMDRPAFLALASTMIRHILVDQARRRSARKRGAGWQRITLSQLTTDSSERDVHLVDLDDALRRLAELDDRQSRIVELRFFGGLTGEEIAGVLGLSRKTVTQEWGMARAWLLRALNEG